MSDSSKFLLLDKAYDGKRALAFQQHRGDSLLSHRRIFVWMEHVVLNNLHKYILFMPT